MSSGEFVSGRQDFPRVVMTSRKISSVSSRQIHTPALKLPPPTSHLSFLREGPLCNLWMTLSWISQAGATSSVSSISHNYALKVWTNDAYQGVGRASCDFSSYMSILILVCCRRISALQHFKALKSFNRGITHRPAFFARGTLAGSRIMRLTKQRRLSKWNQTSAESGKRQPRAAARATVETRKRLVQDWKREVPASVRGKKRVSGIFFYKKQH